MVGLLAIAPARHRAPRGLRRRVLGAVAQEPRGRAAQAAGPLRAPRPVLLLALTPARLGAAAVAVAVVLAVVVLAVSRVASPSPTTRVVAASVVGPGTAQLRVTGGHAELIVRHLTPPPRGEIFEVWLARPHHAPQPTTALFSVDSSGQGDAAVPGDLRGVSTVMVTPEPAGGTTVPTHAPVIIARLT